VKREGHWGKMSWGPGEGGTGGGRLEEEHLRAPEKNKERAKMT